MERRYPRQEGTKSENRGSKAGGGHDNVGADFENCVERRVGAYGCAEVDFSIEVDQVQYVLNYVAKCP
jgi:hypothetical protein